MAESAPEVAQQIFVRLVDEDVRVPIGTSWGQENKVSARDIGCLPQDQELFGFEGGYSLFGRWFDSWRTGQWSPRVPTKPGIREHPAAAAGGGFPVVDPIDAQMLDQLSHWNWDDAVPIDKILEVLAHPEQTMADRLRRLHRYVITGLDISALRHCPPLPVTFKKENPPPVRALAAWAPPGVPPHRCVAGWLVKASQELDRPLNEVLDQAAALMPADWTAPDIDLGPLADYTCSSADAKLVSVALDGRPPWIDGTLGPSHLVEAAATLGRELDKVLALCDKLAPLGVTVAGREKYREGLSSFETEALRQIPILGDPMSPLQLLVIAGRSGRSVRETHRSLSDLEKAGFLIRPDMTSFNAPSTVPNPGALRFIEIYLQRYRPFDRRRGWIATKPCVAITQYSQGRRVSQRIANWAREVLPFGSPEAPVTYPELIDLADSMNCSVSEAREAMLRAFPDAEVPVPTRNAEDLTPLFEIGSALSATHGRPRNRRTGTSPPGPSSMVRSLLAGLSASSCRYLCRTGNSGHQSRSQTRTPWKLSTEFTQTSMTRTC